MSVASDGRTELLFVHGNIGIPDATSNKARVFPQKANSIDTGISITHSMVIDMTPQRNKPNSNLIKFHRHLSTFIDTTITGHAFYRDVNNEPF